MKTKIYLVLFLAVLLNSANVFSQKADSVLFAPVVSDAIQTLYNVNESPYEGHLNHSVQNAVLYAILNFGDNYPGKLDYNYNIPLFITGKNSLGTTIFSQIIPNEAMVINSSQPEQIFKYEITSYISELDEITISIGTIVSSGTDNYFANDITLKVKYYITYGIDVRANPGENPLQLTVESFNPASFSNRIATFSWEDGSGNVFPNYQMQLLRLYNTDASNSSGLSVTTTVDWANALNIETESSLKNLKLTIAEGSGFYIWRVRPVGTFYEGGITNPRNYGKWSNAPEQGESITVSASSIGVQQPYAFRYTDPDEDINWIYSRVFTEGNNVSEKITYAGQLMHVKQTQAYLPSKDTALISHTLIDYSGRPSLTTLPVPVQGGLTGYKANLVKNQSGILYTADDFDKDSLNATDAYYKKPSQVNSTYFDYYSNNNPDLSVPDAEGYPFSRTLYENGGTGRVIEQSGPGKTHTLGFQNDGKGRTVRTSYSTPSEEELIRIFGEEAPDPKSVIKTTTTDQNNTTTVTYTSNEGNVIATCLEINDADTLQNDLGSEGDSIMIKNTIFDNFEIENGFFSSKKISFNDTTTVTISYKVKADALTCGCTSYNFDCGYELKVYIYNSDNSSMLYESNVINLNNYQSSNGYKEITDINQWTPEWTGSKLPPGNYIIYKTIKATSDLDAVVTGSTNTDQNHIAPLVQNIIGWLGLVKTDQQLNTFYLSVQQLSKDIEDAHDALYYENLRFKVYNSFFTLSLETMQFDTSLHIWFDIPFKTGVGVPKPQFLYLSGACCGTMVIPIMYMPEIECFDPDSMLLNDTLRPKFSQYLIDVLTATNPPGVSFGTLLPGYTPALFDSMVFHMLTDKYYAGYTFMYNGNRVKPEDSLPVGANDKKYQYKCEELWDCWKSIVGSYEELLKLNTSSTSVAGELDASDSEDGNSDGTHDSKCDEGEDDMEGGWIMKWIMKRALKNRMREDAPPVRPYVPNLAELFLNCAGYKFAAIIEPSYAEDFSFGGTTYTLLSPAVEPTASDSDIVKYYWSDYGYDVNAMYNAAHDSLRFPFIKNPVYAFKYFEYNPNNVVSTPFLPRCAQIEVWNCYHDYSTFPLCENRCGSGSHLDWSFKERLTFYQGIKSYKPANAEDPDELSDADWLRCPGGDTLQNKFDSLIQNCHDKAIARRSDIRTMVEMAFTNNCYEIGGCPDADNVILLSEINKIVDNIIDYLEAQCEEIKSNSIALYFPKCDTLACVMITPAGAFDYKLRTIPLLLPDCERLRYEQIKAWQFVAAISNLESKCDPVPDNPVWFNNTNIEECSNGEPVPGLEYSKAVEIETIVGQ